MNSHDELRVLDDGGKPGKKMERRRAIQVLFGGMAAGMALPGVAASHPVREHIAHHAAGAVVAPAAESAWAPLYLDAHQNESLIVLGERIVPGSSAALVNRFIDLALSIESQETQERFLRSLAAFEGEALARFKSTFRELAEARQIEILTAAANSPLSQIEKIRSGDWVSNTARGYTPTPLVTLGDHLENLKGWVSGAYYTSEVGMKELGWTGNSAYDDFPGCQHPEGHH